MITLEQLDELESRIIKALELIGDLRTENSRLEAENQKLREEFDKLHLTLEEKERDIQSLRQELQKTSEELKTLKERETLLEKKISEILSRLASAEGNFTNTREGNTLTSNLNIVEEDTSIEIPIDTPIEKPNINTVQAEEKQGHEEETGESLVISTTQNEEHGFEKQAKYKDSLDVQEEAEEDEIIILDEDEEEMILADDLEQEIIIQDDDDIRDVEEEIKEIRNLEEKENAGSNQISLEEEIVLDDEDLGVFEIDDEEDFLIIEENENNTERK